MQSQDNTDLYVPVHIKRITMPIHTLITRAIPLTDCTIRSARPEVDKDCAYWSRSEVRDCKGRLQIVVEHAQARKMD